MTKLKELLEVLAYAALGIVALSCAHSAFLYFCGDRTGNSGRTNHWKRNERIRKPGESE